MNNYVQLKINYKYTIINSYLKQLQWFKSDVTLITVINFFYCKNIKNIL